jgi:hypothetical protein
MDAEQHDERSCCLEAERNGVVGKALSQQFPACVVATQIFRLF